MTLNELYDYALSFHGTLYEWGGDGYTPSGGYGYDCSGFIQKVLQKAGMDPPGDQNAHSLYLHFQKNGIQMSCKGALAFFGSTTRVSHVGWMIDNRIMISAAGGGSHCTSRSVAERSHAKIKIQPISMYHVPPFLGAWTPRYPFP
jgi:cell wall-associated NlpC family hydrolase